MDSGKVSILRIIVCVLDFIYLLQNCLKKATKMSWNLFEKYICIKKWAFLTNMTEHEILVVPRPLKLQIRNAILLSFKINFLIVSIHMKKKFKQSISRIVHCRGWANRALEMIFGIHRKFEELVLFSFYPKNRLHQERSYKTCS